MHPKRVYSTSTAPQSAARENQKNHPPQRKEQQRRQNSQKKRKDESITSGIGVTFSRLLHKYRKYTISEGTKEQVIGQRFEEQHDISRHRTKNRHNHR